MYDIIIIGGGPAGLSAGITAKARNKNALIISNGISTSALYKAEKVDNYLGMPNISGKQMLELFADHANNIGVEFAQIKAQQILSMGDYFSVNAGNEFYEAKTIILTMGKKMTRTIKGEKEFLGKGLSYCATCDGMLYKNKTVAITGDNDEAVKDVLFLSEICEKVHFITKKPQEESLPDNVTLINGEISCVKGEVKVASVTVNSEDIPCVGVFVIAESLPAESLIYGIEMEDGNIKTDKSMKTNINGVFAAGDCTGKPYQISKAVGDGLIAALSAVSYL